VCSVGFATTQVLGCKSEKGCIVQGALFVSPIPPTKGLRLLKASSKLRKALNLIRKARKAERAVEAAEGGAKAAKAVEKLSAELRALSEAHITRSGETVLGHAGYISKARARGASYFDIGNTWNRLPKAKRWAANEHFLDVISSNGDRIILSVEKSKVGAGSTLAKEIKYLRKEKNYHWVNQWSLAQ
jgi:hypothetical protein